MSFAFLAKLFGTAIGDVGEHLDTGDSPVVNLITRIQEAKEHGDTLTGRLTDQRAGYLANLNNTNLLNIPNLASVAFGNLANANLLNIPNLSSVAFGNLANANLLTIPSFTGINLAYINSALPNLVSGGLVYDSTSWLRDMLDPDTGDQGKVLAKLKLFFDNLSAATIERLSLFMNNFWDGIKTNFYRITKEIFASWRN
jgi:hypothetical protein